jgi:hypothetical protein
VKAIRITDFGVDGVSMEMDLLFAAMQLDDTLRRLDALTQDYGQVLGALTPDDIEQMRLGIQKLAAPLWEVARKCLERAPSFKHSRYVPSELDQATRDKLIRQAHDREQSEK